MVLPKLLSTLMLLLGPETLLRSSSDGSSAQRTRGASCPCPLSALCTEFSILMGACASMISVCGGSEWWPAGWAFVLHGGPAPWAERNLEVEWFSSITGFSLSGPSKWISTPRGGNSISTACLGRAGNALREPTQEGRSILTSVVLFCAV